MCKINKSCTFIRSLKQHTHYVGTTDVLLSNFKLYNSMILNIKAKIEVPDIKNTTVPLSVIITGLNNVIIFKFWE